MTIFEQIVVERISEEALAQANLHPARSLLFVGPPGVGKTLSTRWLARSLNMPLPLRWTLTAVMSSFLGRTGNNLRNVLDYAKGFGCILLLDEFDAIAKATGRCGRGRRVETISNRSCCKLTNGKTPGYSLRQRTTLSCLIPAVWRRFDFVVQFDTQDDRATHTGTITQLLDGDTAKLHAALAITLGGHVVQRH